MKKKAFISLLIASIMIPSITVYADSGSGSTSFNTSTTLSNSTQNLQSIMFNQSPQTVPGSVQNGTTQVTDISSMTCNGVTISSRNGIQVQENAAGTKNIDILKSAGQATINALQKQFPNTMKSLLSGSDRFGSIGSSMNQAYLPCGNTPITIPTSTAGNLIAGSQVKYTIYTFHLIRGTSRTDQAVSNANSLLNGVYSTSTSGTVTGLTGSKQFCTGMPPILSTSINQSITKLANGVYQVEVPAGTSGNVNFQCAGVWQINRTIHYVNGKNTTKINWKTDPVNPLTLFQSNPPSPVKQNTNTTGSLVIVK